MIESLILIALGAGIYHIYILFKNRTKPDRITQLEEDVKEIERRQKLIKKVEDLKSETHDVTPSL